MKRGFTLLEVMLALALLGFGLVVLIKSSAGSIFNAEQAHMLGVATDLARGKMYDIEETLIKDGFPDTDCSQTDWKPFETEGWPNVFFKFDCLKIEFPSFDELKAMAQGKVGSGSGSALASGSALGSGSAFGSGSGSAALGSAFTQGSSDPLSNFQNSALGGMLGMMGMSSGDVAGAGVTSTAGGSLIQSQFTMFQQILKVTVRKVKLHVKWQVFGRDRDMDVVAFFTDPAAMDQVLNGLGAVDLGDGSGSGSGSGSATTTTTTTKTGSGSAVSK